MCTLRCLNQIELAQLQAETNRTLSEGITSQLLQQQFIEKWDGKTPLYGDTPLTIFTCYDGCNP